MDKSLKWNGKEKEQSISVVNRGEGYLDYYNPLPHPDQIHTLHTGKGNSLYLPVHKDSAEIDRMWEYEKLMGRGLKL